MKRLFLILFLLSTVSITKAQSSSQATDTLLYKIEILRGTVEQIREGAKQLKLKFPAIKTQTSFIAPNLVLSTDCDQRRKMDILFKELFQDYPTLKLRECKE